MSVGPSLHVCCSRRYESWRQTAREPNVANKPKAISLQHFDKFSVGVNISKERGAEGSVTAHFYSLSHIFIEVMVSRTQGRG